MTKKKSIMVDMDDVIVDGGFLYLINEYMGTNYKVSDFDDYYMQNIVPDKDKFYKYFFTKNPYDHGNVIDGAISGLKALNKRYEVYIGTSYIVPDNIEESGKLLNLKYNYLREKLPFINPNNFIFLGDKSVLNCTIKIDDKVENLKGANTKLLFTAHHNKNISDDELKKDGIVRVNSWEDVKNILLK